jgi:hypothetical protein
MLLSHQLDEKQLKQDVLDALHNWKKSSEELGSQLEKLSLIRSRRKTLLPDKPYASRLAVNSILLEGIEALEKEDEQAARILRLRFLDRETVQAVTNTLGHLNKDQTNRSQRNAIEQLAHILVKQEMAFRQTQIHLLESQLPPPPYNQSGLFGVKEALVTLASHLLQETGPWVMILSGIGGIGKTSLADALVRHIMRFFQFDTVIWIRTATEQLGTEQFSNSLIVEYVMGQVANHLCPDMVANTPVEKRNLAVRQALKDNPHLVVIDNLEVEMDAVHLFSYVSDLANPSKFLITSRTRPLGLGGIYIHTLTDLSLESAAQLIRHHAQDIGLRDLTQATEAEVEPIYNVTGGNPLALKLMVSLATVLPLPEVLVDLVHAHVGQIEQMYRRIYQSVWESLSKNARALLEIMPMAAANGMGESQMQAISGLPKRQLWAAITELAHRSLLEVRGTVQERRYGIHHLTESFLKTDIIGLPDEH